MASIRRVRRDFRKEVLRLVGSGDGNIQKLKESAGKYFGSLIGYEVLIMNFLNNEVGNALSVLRSEGRVESIGKQWKLRESLQPEDARIIVHRRAKRVRGELKEQARFAHEFGMIDEATEACKMLEQMTEIDVPEQVEAPEGCA